jgi:hypothetical protein
MQDARYVRLISWTLQSGSEQLVPLIIKKKIIFYTYIFHLAL